MQEYELGSSMRAALLLEQAALFQLHRTPALTHKFAFYIVLAGTEYQKSSLMRLRAHAYRWAIPLPVQATDCRQLSFQGRFSCLVGRYLWESNSHDRGCVHVLLLA